MSPLHYVGIYVYIMLCWCVCRSIRRNTDTHLLVPIDTSVTVGGIKTTDTIYVSQHFIYIQSNLRINPDRQWDSTTFLRRYDSSVCQY